MFLNNKLNAISVHDLDSKLGEINLIDIREDNEYNDGHVPTAKNVSMGAILKNPEEYLDKSKEYYIICQSGARSSRTCMQLLEEGFNVVNVSGGTGSYLKPLER